jgi:hypothetical protein
MLAEQQPTLMPEILKSKIGNPFPIPVLIIGVILTLGSLLVVAESSLVAVGFVLVGLLIWTSSYGTEIDITNRRYREYTSFFGLKRGQWFGLEDMPYLAILKSRSGNTVYSRSNQSTTDLDDYYDVCLLNETHRKRVVLMRFKSNDEASKYAQNIESKLGLTLTQFNPVVSEKTANRRR